MQNNVNLIHRVLKNILLNIYRRDVAWGRSSFFGQHLLTFRHTHYPPHWATVIWIRHYFVQFGDTLSYK